jgi:hypothetical protein
MYQSKIFKNVKQLLLENVRKSSKFIGYGVRAAAFWELTPFFLVVGCHCFFQVTRFLYFRRIKYYICVVTTEKKNYFVQQVVSLYESTWTSCFNT